MQIIGLTGNVEFQTSLRSFTPVDIYDLGDCLCLSSYHSNLSHDYHSMAGMRA